MGDALNHICFGAFKGRSAGDAAKPGFLRRFYSGFMQARQHQADHELARYFERSGRVLTDDAERAMMRRLMSASGWKSRC